MKPLVNLLLTYSFFLLLPSLPSARADETIVYWNSTNSLFRHRQPTIEVRMGDVVRFVCPDNEQLQDGEFLMVYEVSEFAQGECSLETDSREILRCGPEGNAEKMLRTQQLNGRDRTQTGKVLPKNVAQLIRPINPIPNGKEFQVGQNIFYMTTSTGKVDGLGQRLRGLCETKNMRLTMKVNPSQPPAHPVRPMLPTRRQEDFVTKSSAEMMDGQEDEDSEGDSAHMLPRDLEMATSPKFRRPAQFEKAAASAGVQDQQFLKVIQMAKEGKTGTFENERHQEERKSGERDGWHPVNVQYVADLMNNAYKDADARIKYEREPDFEIHEDNDLAVRSLEYSSSAFSASTMFLLGLLAVVNFFFF